MAGRETHVALHLPKADAAEVEARVIQPNGGSQKANIYRIDEMLYLIEFKPEVKGVHVVSVFHRGEHIAGSPFQFTVGRFGEGGAYKARIGGIDLTVGEVNEILSFNVYTREAGEGTLEVSVEGPSKADVRIIEHEGGNLHVEYKVLVGGVLPSRDKAIIDTTSHYLPSGTTGTELLELKSEANEVTVDGNGIRKFLPGQTASFFVNTAGTVHVTYTGEGRYRVDYLIMENCNAFVYIRYGSSDIPGSPFAVSC
uniref:Uncharacterized protein n=1 Tax=Parascaris equorum TaxID=6256 RepID=A0A914S0X8_PAREQ